MAYKDPNDIRNKESKLKYYHKNKDVYLERNRNKRREMQSYINDLKQVSCMDCGVSYPPYVMDFDHRNPIEKHNTISQLTTKGSWRLLLTEIDKCDIVCANCHRERTFNKQSPIA